MAEKKEEKESKEKPKAAKPPKTEGSSKSRGRKEAKGLEDVVKIAAPGETRVSPKATPRVKVLYAETVVPKLLKQFGYKNPMQVPRLTKIVINCGLKDAVVEPKVLDSVLNDIACIAGQKPVLTRARKSIATFKIREGLAIGARVTLRRARMFEFFDRLVNVALPRVRDFRGVNPRSFDGAGNYSMGIREQIIFPEINYNTVDKIRGFTVTIGTSAKNSEQARALLAELGMPFRK